MATFDPYMYDMFDVMFPTVAVVEPNPDIPREEAPTIETGLGNESVLDIRMIVNSSSPWIFGEAEDRVILPILLSLLALICLAGNGLVIFGTLAIRRMRTGSNLMLVNIAVSDLCFILFCVPTAIVNHATPWGLSDAPGINVCKFVHYSIFVTAYVSVYTLVVMCVFRFCSEFMVAKSNSLLSRGNALVSCLVVWLAFLISHLNLLIAADGAIFQEPFICVHTEFLVDQAKLKTLWVTFMTCAFLLPLLSVCTLSGIVLHQQSRRRRGVATRHPDPAYPTPAHELRSKRELTLVIMATLVVRALCWIPIQVFVMIDVFGMSQYTETYRKAEMLGVCFALAGSCVNPLIYKCASTDYRRAFHQVCFTLGCKCSDDKLEDDNSDMNETIMSIISDSSNHINYT